MRSSLIALTVGVLVAGLAANAEDPKPVQPKIAPKVVAQPPAALLQPKVTATRMVQLEEEYETLEAHREVKKAYVKAAEVGVQAAELALERFTQLAGKGVVTREEFTRAKLDLDLAKAQVAIRLAELKEVEVKVKYAKKRLDDAKLGGVRPVPGVRPVDPKVDPLPN